MPSGRSRGWTYAKAGLNVRRMRSSQSTLMRQLKATWKLRSTGIGTPFGELGHYAATIDLGNGKALAMHTDNVGTKVLIAQMMRKYDTIGIDCIAYNVNDLICIGAEPIAFLDYLVFEEQPSTRLLSEIMKGLIIGAEQGNVAIVGGETAVYPGVIRGAAPGQGFDFSGSCVGLVDSDSIITGSNLKAGDTIVGLSSSGIHASGFTLARKVLLKRSRSSLSKKHPRLERTLGQELLTPTRIYVKPILDMLHSLEIHALAHVTGGAYTKLTRFFPYFKGGFHLDALPRPPRIFTLIQEAGNISEREMYSTFNMGLGMCIMLPKREKEEAISIAKKHGIRGFEVGKVSEKQEIRLQTPAGAKFKLT